LEEGLPFGAALPVMSLAALQDRFRQPPSNYGPIPFYWWAGETLDRERVAWQLDQLRQQGVLRTVVSYPHLPDGDCDRGDPVLFSPEWWEFFRWFLGACRERGMTVGFQDYNLMEPVLTAIGRDTPGMEGGQLASVSQIVENQALVRLDAEPGCRLAGAWAYPLHGQTADARGAVDLSDHLAGNALEWTASPGRWLVVLVFARPAPFDPMHPLAGERVIERFFAPFERECGAELGTTLELFFHDELDFGGRMPFWSGVLLECFRQRAGYDAAPLLPALWHDLGPVTEKFRLDYADVVAAFMGERFFEPVFRWHEERGLLLGHDNCGRGRIAEGRDHYADYFRAMRWYSAPGCDDPKIDGPRAFKGLKVNSSIAHLYQRPRVWIEAFHSSGWGSTPAEVIAAIHEDFACGANLVNLHGLYYTTLGGWWEWAPPDFHFRQPYWEHCQPFNTYLTRLSWLLSQGVHRCSVAVVYPIEALDAKPANAGPTALVAHMGHESISAEDAIDLDPEETAFRAGKLLFDHACDFDFIDAESITRAEITGGELRAGEARYRILLLPAMAALRFSTLSRALEFVRGGGVVIALGCLPRSSDRTGREDPRLAEMIAEIFGSADDSRDQHKSHPGGGQGHFLRLGNGSLLETMRAIVEPVATSSGPLHLLRRETQIGEIRFCSNPSDETLEFRLLAGPEDRISEWDAWTGKIRACDPFPNGALTLAPRQARIFLVGSPATSGVSDCGSGRPSIRTEIDGSWETLILPVLDNRYGDFSLPAKPETVGPQARRFRFADDASESLDWITPDFDDSAWQETTYSFGPQLECLGPLGPGHDPAALDASQNWRPYSFSRRWGIERDPFLTDWLSGPHGLKGKVPDDFLDFHTDRSGSVWYVRGTVTLAAAGVHQLVIGGRCGYQIWINGESVAHQPESMEPGSYPRWRIPHYECEAVTKSVTLRAGVNEVLVRLVQPEGQRTRAFFAMDPPAGPPAHPVLRWFTDPASPRVGFSAPPDRRAIRFRFLTPPGVREISFLSRGEARAWLDGREVELTAGEPAVDGCRRYRAQVPVGRPDPQIMALRVSAPADCHGGDALPEPVSFVCGAGRMPVGDWCEHGLATYSGVVEYRKTLEISEASARGEVHLDLGEVRASAEVRLNGQSVAVLLAPPWSCDLTPFLRAGNNELSIRVANTLANHYSVGIPSPYAFANQTPSGLIGPVTLVTTP
jgi:hypothetical protein